MVLLVLICTAAAIAFVIVGALKRLWKGEPGVDAIPIATSRVAASVVRRRVLVAGVVGTAGALTCFAINQGNSGLYGLPILLAPAVFALLVVTTIASSRVPAPPADASRVADLVPRRPWSFGPLWASVAPATAAVAVIAFLIVAGASSARTADGNWRGFAIEYSTGSSISGPYPGWFYGLPLVVLTVLLVAATVAALVRLSRAPMRGTEDERAGAMLARRLLARFVVLAATGALLVYFGAALALAGSQIANAARNGMANAPDENFGSLALVGDTAMISGVIFAVFGAGLVIAAVYTGAVGKRVHATVSTAA